MTERKLSMIVGAIAAEYDGVYRPDADVYKRVLEVLKRFERFALQNDGRIKNVDIKVASDVKIVAEVPCVDLFRDGLKQFSEALGMIDCIEVSVSNDGYLIVEDGVADLWKAV